MGRSTTLTVPSGAVTRMRAVPRWGGRKKCGFWTRSWAGARAWARTRTGTRTGTGTGTRTGIGAYGAARNRIGEGNILIALAALRKRLETCRLRIERGGRLIPL